MSVGLLHRYLSSKTSLFTAICMSEPEYEMAALSAISRRSPTLTCDHVRGLSSTPANEEVGEVMRLRATTIREFVGGYLTDDVKAGEVPVTTPIENFTESIAMMLDGAVTAWAVSGPELNLIAVRDASVSLLAAALRTPGSPLP